MRANSLFWRLTKTEGEAAIAMLKKAIELYPDYAPAQSMLAFAMLVSRLFGWTLVAPPVKEAAVLAKRAAELDDSDPWVHLALGYVAYMARRTNDAKQEYQRAIDLNPNGRCLWLSRLGARVSGPNGRRNCVFGASHPNEPARSAKRHLQQRAGGRALPCGPIYRGHQFCPKGSATA